MSIFYSDEELVRLVNSNVKINALSYIERNCGDVSEKMTNLIGYAYVLHLLFENEENGRCRWLYFWEDFKKYLKIAVVLRFEEARYNIIVGYMLNKYWEKIYKDPYYDKGQEWLASAIKLTKDKNVKNLARFFLTKKLRVKKQLLQAMDLNSLFPTDSIVDTYFRNLVLKEAQAE